MKVDNDSVSSIHISLAGGSISITEDGFISIGPTPRSENQPRYNLGPATKANFNAIISYFERLSIHATDK